MMNLVYEKMRENTRYDLGVLRIIHQLERDFRHEGIGRCGLAEVNQRLVRRNLILCKRCEFTVQ